MFSKSLIIAASAAHLALATQELGSLINKTFEGARLLQDEDETPKKMDCTLTAKKPGDKCYFKSPIYQAKTAENKMAELWDEIIDDATT